MKSYEPVIKLCTYLVLTLCLFFSLLISNQVFWIIFLTGSIFYYVLVNFYYPRYLTNHRAKYLNHLKSAYWKCIKLERLKYDKFSCCNCQKSVTFYTSHCHHKSYTNLGKETIKDVITLCPKCHNDEHSKH